MTTQEKINQLKEEISVLEVQLEKEKTSPVLFLLEILGNELTLKIDREKYPNSVFYFKGETCFLELQKCSNVTYLWCNYYKIWNPISEKFGLEYSEIQAIIKETVEEHFKLSGITPNYSGFRRSSLVEEHFKLSGITPKKDPLNNRSKVEEHLKLSGITPEAECIGKRIWVEEHFKMRDVTPANK